MLVKTNTKDKNGHDIYFDSLSGKQGVLPRNRHKKCKKMIPDGILGRFLQTMDYQRHIGDSKRQLLAMMKK